MADKVGRRKTFWLTMILGIICCLGYGLSTGYKIFVLFRLLCAVSFGGIILSSFVLSVELVGMSARSFVGLVIAGLFALSYPYCSLMAYLIHNWRVYVVFNALLGFLIFLIWRYVHVPLLSTHTCAHTNTQHVQYYLYPPLPLQSNPRVSKMVAGEWTRTRSQSSLK